MTELHNLITDVDGIKVGHQQNNEGLTGCRLLAVVGLGVAADQAAAPGEPGWELVLQSPPAARLTDNTFSAAGSR